MLMNTTEITNTLSQCNKTKLLMACGLTSASNYTLAAMGYRDDVLFNCSTNITCTHVANEVGWYFSNNYSWGFVNGTDSVSRNTCDTGSTNPTLRLCWNTDGYTGSYRCGSMTNLSSNAAWQRSIWHANQSDM
jgi:hypothetical protein